MSRPELIEVVHRDGIFIPEADLWLDPPRRKARALISHAHSDHFARHDWTLCTPATADLIHARYGEARKGKTEPLEFGKSITINGFRAKLLPAGHVLGSAMLHLERLRDGATLLYTGDFKLRDSLTTRTAELMPADTLVMETTFGRPLYRFPSRSDVRAQLHEFVKQAVSDVAVPVLLGYSLGKAQELQALLADCAAPLMVHDTIAKFNEVYRSHGVTLPEHRDYNAAAARGHVVIAPPGAATELQNMFPCRRAMATGWALMKGAKYRFGVDEIFPVSDHADYDELLACVDAVKPKVVRTVHGSTTEFARDLRRRGIEAWSLIEDEQIELPLMKEDGVRFPA